MYYSGFLCKTGMFSCLLMAMSWEKLVFLQPSLNDRIMNLPEDPMMLLSAVNMKLRDTYASLDELCEDMDVNKEVLVKKLADAGFEYSEENNRFW